MWTWKQGGPSVVVTNLKLDIVVIDKEKKTVDIFELTCPGESRIDTANKIKADKYAHFLSDITTLKPSVVPNRNKESLKMLHSYCKTNIKLKNFKNNISAINILGSYFIFNCRNNLNWESMDTLLAPFPNQRN